MLYLRAFISGIVIPSVILPIVIVLALWSNLEAVLTLPFIHFIPIFWGIWNILYFAGCENFLPGNENTKLFISGACLGFLVALLGVFWLEIPAFIGIVGNAAYLPLVAAPIIYGILWAFGVKYLNRVVGIQ